MGLFNKLTSGFKSKSNKQTKNAEAIRVCRFETMEDRRMLDADPVVAGITYLEGDTGEDTSPDYFEVTFQGGSSSTQMTQFVVNGDQDNSGSLSNGDIFFDNTAGGPGAGGYHGFQFDAANSSGITASDILSVDISADGLSMTVNVQNFEAGDKLAFTVDVDEVEGIRDDKIASGVEFEGTRFNAQFVDQHYNFSSQDVSTQHTLDNGANQNQVSGIFYDEYDSIMSAGNLLAENVLALNADNQTGQADRTDGAIDVYTLTPKPVTIEGTVYHDENADCHQDSNETGIAGVSITLEVLNKQTGLYEFVATTQTDQSGNYSFGEQYNLQPGTYRLIEGQPQDYISVGANPGTVNGSSSGSVTQDTNGEPNIITDITISQGGMNAVDYDFCEVKQASLSGHVWHDQNDNGVRDAGEAPIANVMVQISRIGSKAGGFNDPFAAFQTVTVFTDSNGYYHADMLPPGIYEIVEISNYPSNADPLAGFIDGKDSIGSGTTFEGFASNDAFTGIELCAGEEGVNFDFGEIQPVIINGHVSVTTGGDCLDPSDPNHRGIEGVTIQLFDDFGLVATTTTNSHGYYEFLGLKPGTYRIVEIQPTNYFDGDQTVGTAGGTSANDEFRGVVLASGESGLNYNFCEHEGAAIEGRVWEDGPNFVTSDGNLPSDYRSQRDGIYQANVDNPIAGVKMSLYFFNDIQNGSLNPRAVTLNDVIGNHYSHMNGMPGDTPIYVFTDANGEYRFDGLPAGNYIVLEAQPDGFSDANDVVGNTTGFTYNSEVDAALAPQTLTNTFSTGQLLDSINGIQVQAGGVSSFNNFTEVRATKEDDPNEIPPGGEDPRGPSNPPRPPAPPLAPGWLLYRHQGPFQSSVIGGAIGIDVAPETGYTWHLSVINGGNPRGESMVAQDDSAVWIQASHLTEFLWSRDDMDDSVWTFAKSTKDGGIEVNDRIVRFGMNEGQPLAGDFNGDGIDELAIYDNGYFFIDIDGNGKWSRDDMVAKLGERSDQPVVGDWDGDGKDDIGIFGPRWDKDAEAIAREPGLPNPANDLMVRPKNIPPVEGDATEGVRVMRLTSRGGTRADLIDHVFEYGEKKDIAIAGDWNGNGIRSVGVFREGTWHLDVDGNGQFDYNDLKAEFGQKGDIPVVGDFNGDGIEEIGVYRDGQWIIDTNNNREIDATDKVFELGSEGVLPVVGDWDGDGTDDPGIYDRNAG